MPERNMPDRNRTIPGAGAFLAACVLPVCVLPVCVLAGAPAAARQAPPFPAPLPPPRPALSAPDAPIPPRDRPPAPTPPEAPAKDAASRAESPAENAAPASACRAELAAAGARFSPAALSSQADPGCDVEDPLRLESLAPQDGGRIDLPDRPTLGCAAAQSLAAYVSDALAPLARGLFGAKLASLGTGPGFECRRRNHAASGKLSAHARGLAVDVAALRLEGGRAVAVGRFADAFEAAFDRAARAAGCGYFNTALGPGADPDHAFHWHFDLEPRGANGRSKFCQ